MSAHSIALAALTSLKKHWSPLAALESPFVALFDGDTEPHRDFLTRTLPLFYRFEPETKRWRVSWEVGFVQTRQRFKNVAHRFGPDDPLNQSNGVFFSAIQVRTAGEQEADDQVDLLSSSCCIRFFSVVCESFPRPACFAQ